MPPTTSSTRRSRGKPGTKETLTKQLQVALGRLGATEARRKEAHDSALRLDADAREISRREMATWDVAMTAIEALEADLRVVLRQAVVKGLKTRLHELREERKRWAQQAQLMPRGGHPEASK